MQQITMKYTKNIAMTWAGAVTLEFHWNCPGNQKAI
jgi:hypothetical protein